MTKSTVYCKVKVIVLTRFFAHFDVLFHALQEYVSVIRVVKL